MLTQEGKEVGGIMLIFKSLKQTRKFPGVLFLKPSFCSLCYQSCSITLDLNANTVSLEGKVSICGGKNIAMSLVLFSPSVR